MRPNNSTSTARTAMDRYTWATRSAVALDEVGYRGTTRATVGPDASTSIGWTRCQVRVDRPWQRSLRSVQATPATAQQPTRAAA